jgi:hypothetical protein
MNSLQDLIKRLTAIGQVNEEAEEKCPDCGKVHEGDCAVEESKKPDADKDGIPDWADKDEEKVDEAKKPDADKDGIPDWADEDNKEKEVKESALNLLRRYAGMPGVHEGTMDSLKALGKKALDTLGHKDDEELIKDMQKQQGQEPTGKKPEPVKEDTTLNVLRQLAGIQECGDMPMAGEMSPMTAVPNGEPHMGIPAEVMAQMSAPEQGPEQAQPEIAMAEPEAPKATYTLNISNGDNNLSMTTDVPDEIIHIMKLAGVNKGAEVTKKEMPADGEQEVEESGYENTPDNTRARDPQAHGDIRDWGQKGTANAKTHYTPAKSGDNPMNEQRMFDDYKNFKAGK